MNTEHEAILAGYRQHLDHSPLRGHSARTYLGSVRGFLEWLDTADVDGDPLGGQPEGAWAWAVRDYRTFMITVLKRAPSTTNKAAAALDNFAAWRGLGKAEVKRQEIPRRAPKALEPRAVTRFLRAVEACPRARDRAIALTPFYSGARIAEVERLDVDDVRLSARKGILHLVGKGEKSRDVPVHPKLREALAAWLAERPSWPGADCSALFLNRRGGRLTAEGLTEAIQSVTTAAGLADDDITPHVLRHTFATRMLRGDPPVDIVTVSELLGHARLETTRVYVQPTEEDLEKAIASLPVDE